MVCRPLGGARRSFSLDARTPVSPDSQRRPLCRLASAPPAVWLTVFAGRFFPGLAFWWPFFAGERKETWGEVRLGGESYPGKSQSPTLWPSGPSGAEQEPQKGLRRARASLGGPSIPSLMPTCEICTAGGSSGLALRPGPTAPRFGGLGPDQLWKPKLLAWGVAGRGPRGTSFFLQLNQDWGCSHPTVPLVPLPGGFFDPGEVMLFSSAV